MCAPGPLFASLAAEALACQCRLRHVESYFSSTTSLKRHSKNKVILSPHVSEDTCRIPSWVASLLCFRHFIARVNHCDSFIYWNYSHFISGHRERNIIGCDWIITTGKLTKIQMISNEWLYSNAFENMFLHLKFLLPILQCRNNFVPIVELLVFCV